ncbi:MAG: PDZ domain-containing protein [Ignavibacteria bacterium]|nr:PDZ domain-containing protein [Ignavibacteria bacterium]
MLHAAVLILSLAGDPSTSIDTDLVVVRETLRESYVRELHDSILMRPTVDSIVKGCDKYTFAASPEATQYLGDHYGLFARDQGLDINPDSVGLYISKVLYGTSSYNAGICIGDRVTTINNDSVSGKTWIEAMNMIIGSSEDMIRMELVRNGREMQIDIENASYFNSGVTSMVDNHIGYIRIASFTRATGFHVSRILAAFKRDRIRRVVVDLRANGGGLIGPAVGLLEHFAGQGDTLYSLHYKGDSLQLFTAEAQGSIHGKPLEVLVGKRTASASEIFALGVKANDYGYILGDSTYGKGRMQRSVDLPSGKWFQYTQAIIKGPKDICIDREFGSGGLAPDLPFDMGGFEYDSLTIVASHFSDVAALRARYPAPDAQVIENLRASLPVQMQALSAYYIARIIWSDLGQLYWVTVQPRYTRWKKPSQLARQ